jgi:ABC-type phosphate transport system auxiliary subunit
MPVTARLSKKFYDRFGDDIANDSVDWFNQVDATYRADLRELNELNFARFDAKLEQRVAQLDAKLEQRTSQLEAKLDQRIFQLESKLEAKIGSLRAELIKWMFIFWAGTVIPVVGMVALLSR